MAAYRRIYDSRHLQADCQEPGSAAEPYARYSSMGYLYLFLVLWLFYQHLYKKNIVFAARSRSRYESVAQFLPAVPNVTLSVQ